MIENIPAMSQAGLFVGCADLPHNFITEIVPVLIKRARKSRLTIEVMVAGRPSVTDAMKHFLVSRMQPFHVRPGDVLVIVGADPMGVEYDHTATTRFVSELLIELSGERKVEEGVSVGA